MLEIVCEVGQPLGNDLLTSIIKDSKQNLFIHIELELKSNIIGNPLKNHLTYIYEYLISIGHLMTKSKINYANYKICQNFDGVLAMYYYLPSHCRNAIKFLANLAVCTIYF